MNSRDYLTDLVDDIDIDLSENEIDDILNEKEIDDIEILEEDPLKLFYTPNRISLRYTENPRDIEEDRQRLEMFLQLDKPSNKIFEKVDPLDLIHKKELQDAISTDNILKTSLKDKNCFIQIITAKQSKILLT